MGHELLKIFDVPKSLMPVVMDSNSHFGDISKDIINVELPILSILGDQQAAAVGQACFNLEVLNQPMEQVVLL